jgi:hypothetical protein
VMEEAGRGLGAAWKKSRDHQGEKEGRDSFLA